MHEHIRDCGYSSPVIRRMIKENRAELKRLGVPNACLDCWHGDFIDGEFICKEDLCDE